MPVELAEKLDSAAAADGVTRSEFIRRMLGQKVRRKAPTREDTLRFCGILKGLPKHLSTIEGFGFREKDR
jgi:metal-responsive CopG/Arc/MetJ family transcriptional regulator